MSARTEQEVAEALRWAVDEAEAQLRTEPAHRLRPSTEHAWSLDAPSGVGVHVEVTGLTVSAATATVVLVASTTGWRSIFHRRDLERTVELPLDGDAARVPARLYLVFDDGGHVSAFESLAEAGEVLESADLGSLTGAFADDGEVVAMTPGDLFIGLRATGARDVPGLEALMRSSRGPRHLADHPREFALQVWLSS